MKLEYLAPYLPYNLKIFDTKSESVWDLVSMSTHEFVVHNASWGIDRIKYGDKNYRLILRDLSDLTKEIEHDGERFVPIESLQSRLWVTCNIEDKEYLLSMMDDSSSDFSELQYWIYIQLIEWHFDVFKLIDKGLAVNINDL